MKAHSWTGDSLLSDLVDKSDECDATEKDLKIISEKISNILRTNQCVKLQHKNSPLILSFKKDGQAIVCGANIPPRDNYVFIKSVNELLAQKDIEFFFRLQIDQEITIENLCTFLLEFDLVK